MKRKIVKLIYIVHVQGFKSASRIHEITVLTSTSGSIPKITLNSPGHCLKYTFVI
jgi:hypothetical protein